MISESNTGLSAEEWFGDLPTDGDRSMVTGVIAAAYQFRPGGEMFRPHEGKFLGDGYIGVYAIGSRATGDVVADSDLDLLVAHNLRFSYGGGIQSRHLSPEGQLGTFPFDRLRLDPVSIEVSYAIAASGEAYRLPSSYDGNLPDTYRMGGAEHKAFARYQAQPGATRLDVVYYRGWHSVGPTEEEVARGNALAEETGDEDYRLERSVCGSKCRGINFSEGTDQHKFETFIDTDYYDRPLQRVPLYTFGGGKKTIYIPQIRGLIEVEQGDADSIPGYRRSWEISRPDYDI